MALKYAIPRDAYIGVRNHPLPPAGTSIVVGYIISP